MKFKNLYSHSKCPHCDKFTISFWQKMSLADYRYTHTCKECNGTIQLPAWHAILFLSEVIMLIAIAGKFSLNTWQTFIFRYPIFNLFQHIKPPFV